MRVSTEKAWQNGLNTGSSDRSKKSSGTISKAMTLAVSKKMSYQLQFQPSQRLRGGHPMSFLKNLSLSQSSGAIKSSWATYLGRSKHQKWIYLHFTHCTLPRVILTEQKPVATS